MPTTYMPNQTVSLNPGAQGPAHGFLPMVLGIALAIRVWVVATHTYVVYPDETFQYLEPAHRLAFGSGIITWEYLDGIRSWLLPGVLAGIMKSVAAIDDDPAIYILVIRLLCSLASLSVPFVAYKMAARRLGPLAGLLTGLLAACSSEAVYFAPTIMTEPLATYAALLAVWCGDRVDGQTVGKGRIWAAGLLFGLACSLRFQYAPILALAALAQHAHSTRDMARVATGTTLVVLLVFGVLDTLTWGAPFQSVWMNYLRNASQGVGAAFGTQPWYFYIMYYFTAWWPLAAVLLFGAALGAVKAPVLAVTTLCTIGLHSLTPHKEVRFVLLATLCLPILVGLGLAELLRRGAIRYQRRLGAPAVAAIALVLSGFTAVSTYVHVTADDAWHRERAVLEATLAARAVPNACALGVRSIWVTLTGGYAWWHRDLPIYFETWEAAQILPHSTFRMRMISRLDGKPVPQYPGPELAANASRFNVMIGTESDGLPGFTKGDCFGRQPPEKRVICVFTRPGPCT